VVHHRQKVLAFFAAMRGFAKAISQRFSVLYFTLDAEDNEQDLAANLTKILRHTKAQAFVYQAPDEWRLDEQLAGFSCDQVSTTMADTEHFFTSRNAIERYFKSSKSLLLETFYRQLRRETGYLMDADKPQGEQWNFDNDNRQKLPERVSIPEPLTFANDVTDIDELLTK